MENTTKTIREWFQELPEPYASQAIANSLPGNLMATCDNIFMAFSCGFTFKNSKEGLGYWKEYYEKMYLADQQEKQQDNGK